MASLCVFRAIGMALVLTVMMMWGRTSAAGVIERGYHCDVGRQVGVRRFCRSGRGAHNRSDNLVEAFATSVASPVTVLRIVASPVIHTQ